MRILMIGKYPPIQGGVSAQTYAAARALADAGHQVHVITNAPEVECTYRQLLYGSDVRRLEYTPASPAGYVRVHETVPLRDHIYVPWATPYASKLFGLALSVASDIPFDIVVGWYFEPYGWIAAQVAGALKVPLLLRHAGSDLGRLSHHANLTSTYAFALQGARAVITAGGKDGMPANRLRELGVSDDKLVHLGVPRLPPWFDTPSILEVEEVASHFEAVSESYPLDPALLAKVHQLNRKPLDPTVVTVGVYGKVGEVKGSFELIAALGNLARQGASFNFVSLAGGRASVLSDYYSAVLNEEGLGQRAWVLPFVAPWRVPSLIKMCDVCCFLERDFPISFHAPNVPREVLAAGACLVCSQEVAEKQPFHESLSDGKNFVLVPDPKDVVDLAARLAPLLRSKSTAYIIGRHGSYLSDTCERFFLQTNPMVAAIEDTLNGITRVVSRQDN